MENLNIVEYVECLKDSDNVIHWNNADIPVIYSSKFYDQFVIEKSEQVLHTFFLNYERHFL